MKLIRNSTGGARDKLKLQSSSICIGRRVPAVERLRLVGKINGLSRCSWDIFELNFHDFFLTFLGFGLQIDYIHLQMKSNLLRLLHV